MSQTFELQQIAIVRSGLTDPGEAPMQGNEGAPDAWVEVDPQYTDALIGVTAGQDVILVTWFHLSRRDVLLVHPRSDETRPLTGVFASRSPERPNPLGLHRVTVRQIEGARLRVGPLEAVDGTPVIDIKPVLDNSADA
jgi:tRNA-Thr(GGU) m(6)t(6)A37 methyltransferase TsaA